MKLLRTSVSMFVLAVSNLALSQSTFVAQFDSAQAGYGAVACAVREVPDGYLVFGRAVSDDGTFHTRFVRYRIGANGTFIDRREFCRGDAYYYDPGYIDPVGELDTGGFIVGVTRFHGDQDAIYTYRFNESGDSVTSDLVLTYPPIDTILVGCRQIRPITDGGYFIGGFKDTLNETPGQGLLIRLGPQCDLQWSRSFGPSDELNEVLGVAEYLNHGFLAVGYRLNVPLMNSSFLIRTDSLGNQLWRRDYGNKARVNGAVRVSSDSTIITWSEYREAGWPVDFEQMMLRIWNSSGQVIMERRIRYAFSSATSDLEILPDQSIIALGVSIGRVALTKFSSAGDSLWSRNLTAVSGYHLAYDVQQTSDGGFVMCGGGTQQDPDPHPGLQTIFVIKTDSLGCVVPGCQNVGVQEYVMDLQNLLRVSPNPAREVVSVSLQLPEGGEVEGRASVQLLDASGRLVLHQPVDQILNQLRATLDVSALPAGTYYLHLLDGKRWLAGSKVVVE